MKLATIAEVRNHLTEIARMVQKTKKPVVVTRRGKPYIVLEPITADDLDELAFQYSDEVRHLIRGAEEDIRKGRVVTHKEYMAGKRSYRR